MTQSPRLRMMAAAAMTSLALPMLVARSNVQVVRPNEEDMNDMIRRETSLLSGMHATSMHSTETKPTKPRKNKAQRQARRAQRKK